MFGGVNMLEGGLWTMPYFYEWGAGLTIPEAFNEAARYSSNRHLLTFARGGSRQYNKPFGFYQTVFGWATYANSIYSEEEAHRLAKAKKMPYHPGEDFGVSASYHLRLLMLAYYAGSTVQQFEGEPGGYAKRHKDNSWTLTNNGKSLKKVYDWVSSPEGKRGTFYSPILLLNDYHSGNWDWRQNKNGPWNVWYMYPYEDGDYVFVGGIRQAIIDGNEKFEAKVIRANGSVDDITLYVKGLTDDEKEIILDGCLMNYYKNHNEQ